MGAGIAELCARRGLAVTVAVRTEAAGRRAREWIEISLRRAAERGCVSDAELCGVLAGIRFTTDLSDLCSCQLVFEAVQEDAEVKRRVLDELEETSHPSGVIFASATTSIPLEVLALSLRNSARLVGVRFVNPAPVVSVVEFVKTEKTTCDVVERTISLLKGPLGKRVLQPAEGAQPFNALLIPYLLAAIRIIDRGPWTVERVDSAMLLPERLPTGPLALCDHIGLDIVLTVATELFGEFGETHLAPPPLLTRMVDAGTLGEKTGRGFYEY